MKRIRDMQRDWQGLESKLAKGKSLEQASIEMGIPIEEAQQHAKEKLGHTILDDLTLHLAAGKALQVGLEQLQRIAEAGPLKVKWSEGRGEGISQSETIAATDLDAAKALVRFSLDVRKILGDKGRTSEKTKGSGPKDLFDFSTNETEGTLQSGPWKLKMVR